MKNHVCAILFLILPIALCAQTVSYDFEDNDLSNWVQSTENRWEITTTNPLNGQRSLKHAGPAATDKDRISMHLPAWDGNSGNIIWRFRLRHRFAPSGSNHWAVFLMADKNATGMIAGSGVNGYAVGVNLTTTDDIVRLYRITNGTFTSILSTSLNWETQVGTGLNSIGAVEVERKNDGTFILRIATNGVFTSLQNYGSVNDNTYAYNGFFGIYFSYTSTGTGTLHVDDLSFTYKPVNTNDRVGQVLDPNQQIAAGTISSLLVNQEQAVNVFRFKIQEQGSTDGLPLQPTKLRFRKVSTVNSTNWQQAIAGVRIRGNISFVPLLATYITDNTIDVEIDKSSMLISNNTSREFTLSIYLKQGAIVDGQTLCMQVDKENHGWEADFSGSDFAETFPASVTSNVFSIQVLPTHLTFNDIPSIVTLNKPFDIKARATDANGNLALGFNSGNVQLSKVLGDGVLQPINLLTSQAVAGIVEWKGITYSKRDILRFSASAEGLISATSPAINVINESTSTVIQPVEQIMGMPIQSTLNTLGKAVEVFRFSIADNGEYDKEPTIVRQIQIKRPTGTNLASYSANIAGVMLKIADRFIPIGNPNILTASIAIPLPSDALIIPDGDSVQVSLMVYLKSNGLTDGLNLQFMVDAQSHNCIASETGSTFEQFFAEPVISNLFPIEVKSTRLVFSTTPQSVGQNEPFLVEVSAVDEGGSIDIHTTGSVLLSKNSGDGWLNIPSATSSFIAGKATWSNLTYSYFTPVPFAILASSTNLNDVVSSLIYCADRNTAIQNPTQQVQGGLISTTFVDPINAVEVLKFNVTDFGTTDQLPTFITQMVFRAMEQPTDYPLNKVIGGVVLWADGVKIDFTSSTITSNTITLSFGTEGLRVADKTSVSFTLGVYLKKGGQVDGSTLRLFIPPSGHGWQTSNLGSGFPSLFDQGIIGASQSINVVGVRLSFTNQPFTASATSPISLSVAVTDQFGSIDVDASGTAKLDLDIGPAIFSTGDKEIPLVAGKSIWSDVLLQAIGGYRFKAISSDNNISTSFSETIWCGGGSTCNIKEDFEGMFLSFPITSHWEVSTVSPIVGNKSLKHLSVGTGSESSLSIPITVQNLGDRPMEWSFIIRNGQWDPTADNAFWFVLASESESVKLGEFNGYAVGVNLSGSNDLLSLWRLSKEQNPKLVIQSDFDWNENETVLIKVTRSSKGEWTLWFQPEFGKSEFKFGGKELDAKYTNVVSCGPVFKFTSSRAGEFWLDNLNICGATYPPVIESARLLNQTSIEIKFSGALNQVDAGQKSKYRLKKSNGQNFEILAAYPSPNEPSRVTLRTQQLPVENVMLKVLGLRSANGSMVVNDSTLIGFGGGNSFGSIIINELMARPSPMVGLPNVEYIELFNRTNLPISLKGWQLRGNSNIINLPEVTINQNEYLILCGNNGASLLSSFGKTVGVTSFPTLLVGGMHLALYDQTGTIISWVEYSDSWYKSDTKKTGGYSLERIDPNNIVQGAENWIASNDPLGGTPGRENSVLGQNSDISRPKVVELKVVDANKVELGFTEPMDSLSITLTSNYSISKDIGNPLWAFTSGPKYNRVSLTLASSMALGEIYEICFNPSITDFSGNPIDATCLNLAIPQEAIVNDIVINEVLFNPYVGGVDFVEVFNKSNKTIDLNKIWIANLNIPTTEINEIFPASDASWLLFPNNYAVLCDNPELVNQFYTVENPDALVLTRRMPSYPNDIGTVLLVNGEGTRIDEFTYSDKMHNKLLADVKGVSLERIHPNLPSNEPSSWQSAAQTAGFATPTSRNSQYAVPVEVEDNFSLSSKIFTPNNDGIDDFVMIGYMLPDPGYIANILVFDSKGRLVRRLASNITLGTQGNIKWDGTNDTGLVAPLGAYIVFIETFDLKGSIKRYKKTVVVTPGR